jgi:hypothetical protein
MIQSYTISLFDIESIQNPDYFILQLGRTHDQPQSLHYMCAYLLHVIAKEIREMYKLQ